MIRVVHYVTYDGIDPFERWFLRQSSQVRARILTRIDRIELGNLGDHRSVGKSVSELRIDFGAGYRVYYGRDGDALVVLLYGGTNWTVVRSNVRIKTSKGRNSFGMSTFRRSEMPVREHKASDYLSTPEDIAAYLNAAI